MLVSAELRKQGNKRHARTRRRRQDVARIGRGLDQLQGAEADVENSLAEAGKRIPKALIRLVSAVVVRCRSSGADGSTAPGGVGGDHSKARTAQALRAAKLDDEGFRSGNQKSGSSAP